MPATTIDCPHCDGGFMFDAEHIEHNCDKCAATGKLTGFVCGLCLIGRHGNCQDEDCICCEAGK